MKKLAILFLFFLLFSCTEEDTLKNNKPNILFIAVDDLRPELGCYGSETAISPNIDQLAKRGILFNKAYCQQAICGPSRASILTGIRPESSGVFHNYIKFRESNPNVVTLPQHFGAQGYQTVYCGKIFHHGDLDDELSWNRLPALDSLTSKGIMRPDGFALDSNIINRKEQAREMNEAYGDIAKFGLAMGSAYEGADVPDNGYLDGYNTELAIATMKELSINKDKPFFLALGFNKPHLNWTAPKKYWDLYDREDIELSTQVKGPENGAEMGIHSSFELRTRSGIPKEGDISPELAITLKHAYLACVSYVDEQVGRIIKALDEEGLSENTIIVLWSDHGWHLGDMGIWGKATNYEIATRVPMVLYTPSLDKRVTGTKTDALVELVDIYPTLCEMAGIETPEHIEGQSFAPLLKKPNMAWKKAVFSQFPTPALREWGAYPLRPAMRETFFGPLIQEVEKRIVTQQKDNWDRDLFENRLMGYAMRTPDYRFIVWQDLEDKQQTPVDIELYDHRLDPLETKNIAEENPELVSKLLVQYEKGWKGNRANSIISN